MTSAVDKPRKALGRGLSALLPNRPTTVAPGVGTAPAAAPSPQEPTRLPIGSIHPNPMQPRSVFNSDRLEELAASIRSNGIIQPLIVRRHGDVFQIVAGERRWRAAKLAEVADVPVVVVDVADPNLLEIALVENIQREDLNPIETAHAYDRLNRELGLSPEEIGRRTGKDRTSIVNMIRLLKLPKEVQGLLAVQRLSMGHARAILGLPTHAQQIEIAEKAAAQGMSVRQVEALVQQLAHEGPRGTKTDGQRGENKVDPNLKAAIDQLERVLGTRVRIVESNDQRGRIEIEYYSQAELDRLFQHIAGSS
jgi:ParB family transcriptional regulator, chromosome partitioning protein